MMMRWRVRTAVTFCFLAIACTPETPPQQQRQFETPRLLSLSPASLGRSLSQSQRVTGEFEDRKYEMRFEVEVTPARLTIVGLSLMGVTLFTLVQDQGLEPVVTRLDIRSGIDPRHMLFDFYVTNWPADTLQNALSPLSMRLIEDREKSVRRVYGPDGNVIARIDYPAKNLKNGVIVIQHFDIPYRLRIESL